MIQLFFDVDDTLYDQLETFERAFCEVFGERLPDGEYPSAFREMIYKRSRYHSDVVFDLVESGQMSKEEMYRYRIIHAFQDMNLTLDAETAMRFQETYSRCQDEIVLLPEMEKILDWACERQIPLGIITNGPTEHQWAKVERLGLKRWIRPGQVIVSEEAGAAKPNVGIFQIAERRTGASPSETWLIGDSYESDIVGAKRAGWHALWINRRHRKLPDEPGYRPDAIARRPGECWELLKEMVKEAEKIAEKNP
ncbi:MAG: HAD family hydrolase [Clostridiales bacterium]|nr:HAD family hydrolase [Clostridiales bacterium]